MSGSHAFILSLLVHADLVRASTSIKVPGSREQDRDGPPYLSRIGHIVPVRRWEVHLAHQDLIKEHLLVITTSVETNNKRKQS